MRGGGTQLSLSPGDGRMDGLVSCSIPDIYDNRDGSYISEVCKYVLCIIGPQRLVKTFFSESVEVKEVVPTLRSQCFLLEICIYWGTIFYFLENNPSGNNAYS